MEHTTNTTTHTTGLTCEVCGTTDGYVDEVEFTYGPFTLETPTLCEACADDYDPRTPDRYERRMAWV